MDHPKRTGTWAALPVLACLVGSNSAVQAAEWEWTAIPYLWAAGVGLDVEASDDPVLGGDLSFPDLLDKIQIGGMLHFEGRSGKAGFFVDGAYLSVADTVTTPSNPPLLPDGATIDSGLTMGRYEAVGFYRVEGEASGVDVFLGARLIDVDQQADITRSTPAPASTSASASGTLLDGFLGVRFGMPFAERWWFNVRGDVGTGDTKLSWTANAGFGVWFGKHRKYGLEVAYEYFEFETEKQGDLANVDSQCRFSGPVVGFVFRF